MIISLLQGLNSNCQPVNFLIFSQNLLYHGLALGNTCPSLHSVPSLKGVPTGIGDSHRQTFPQGSTQQTVPVGQSAWAQQSLVLYFKGHSLSVNPGHLSSRI